MDEKLIGRRRALKYFGLLSASAAGVEFLANWLPGGRETLAASPLAGLVPITGVSQAMPASTGPYVPQFFKPEEFRTVGILTEMIIPTDDQPGAKEARVADYIDFVVYSAAEFEPSMQKQWIDGLGLLNELSGKKYGNSFSDLSPSQREELLTEMSAPEHNPKAGHPGFDFYMLLKSMTLESFFTSKVGLIDFLEYKGLAFLTEFPGCTHPEHQT
ncbi:MAG: gluconate 2-dehydrogenase subunit 3 family protein [Acidobacteria bacterium]|nr:MAG: gluconate 2-dehydrogenase subunit 3 family protein [Acidobacteriota bacterium]